ncbi:DUF2460 domain-containing protein [Sphingomonas aracearum]|uniref:TIGR02217 family protein n=1 Tax=Sphingomonas aracearum TaxID=2283317 RepID=A0A369VUQ8_9SPHN|nr:DUF2460 domain-containing protein [Sphingomonas aracearum]RDE04812.1 TIGR02217 family protein [Sphingomonas aracearum]
MGYCLVEERRAEGVVSRFDPRFWTVNFPRPMMAAVTTTAPDALRVDAVFYRADDLAGLIWEAEDRHDHPLLAYETARDFRECRLSFRWRSGGVRALDAVHGPVLTIEGRDEAGQPRSWYVRLWNHATGAPEDAKVSIDFADVAGGFLLPDEADPVWAGDVDRMFVSLVPPDYDGTERPLDAPAEGWAELSDIRCEGPGSVLAIGDAVLPEHKLGIASGYDDSYHLTPARLLRNALHLGYRGRLIHYLGMSHYFRLEANSGGFFVSLAGGALNVAAAAWQRDFASRARALGFEIVWSLSYELLDQHCWGDWKQRAADGSPALTGWVPPSTLLSPAHGGAMAYLQAVAREVMGIALAAGLQPKFQVGEPWWWVKDGSPCLHDAAARLGAERIDLTAPVSERDKARLDAAGLLLSDSTAALCAAARQAAPGCETLLLTFLPTVLDPAMPEARRANLPVGWAGAFDTVQLEDYDWVTAGNTAASARGAPVAMARLGVARAEYLAGFVLNSEDKAQWRVIEAAARGWQRGRAYLWALPQVMRDGLVVWEEEESVQDFDDVAFPLALGREAEVTPEFSTAIQATASGHETRNASWAEARTRYDVGPGVRSEADIAALLAFFRARMGPARSFRLRDPFDWRGERELLGIGDGVATRFALARAYGEATRAIALPVAGSVRVFVGGAQTQAFSVENGAVALDAAPAAGAEVRASFDFDVRVRFAEDRLTVSRASFLAGAAPSVPLVEVR